MDVGLHGIGLRFQALGAVCCVFVVDAAAEAEAASTRMRFLLRRSCSKRTRPVMVAKTV